MYDCLDNGMSERDKSMTWVAFVCWCMDVYEGIVKGLYEQHPWPTS